MKIAMGNDHSAIELKNIIKEFVESKGYEVIDLGTNSTESCDYPVYGEKVGRAVASGPAYAASHILQSFPECIITPMYLHLVQEL